MKHFYQNPQNKTEKAASSFGSTINHLFCTKLLTSAIFFYACYLITVAVQYYTICSAHVKKSVGFACLGFCW